MIAGVVGSAGVGCSYAQCAGGDGTEPQMLATAKRVAAEGDGMV